MKNYKPYVLFADDDPDIRELLMVAGGIRGWETMGASGAREMIEIVNKECDPLGTTCFDCIVADIQFRQEDDGPRLSGITAIDSIRKRYPKVAAIYYSGYISALNKSLIREQGVPYIEKPANLELLLERIEYVLSFLDQSKYSGPERRETSINHAGYTRRSTDALQEWAEGSGAEVPRVVEEALQAAKTINDAPSESQLTVKTYH